MNITMYLFKLHKDVNTHNESTQNSEEKVYLGTHLRHDILHSLINNQKPNKNMIKVHLFQILPALCQSEVTHLVLRDQITGNVYVGGRISVEISV